MFHCYKSPFCSFLSLMCRSICMTDGTVEGNISQRASVFMVALANQRTRMKCISRATVGDGRMTRRTYSRRDFKASTSKHLSLTPPTVHPHASGARDRARRFCDDQRSLRAQQRRDHHSRVYEARSVRRLHVSASASFVPERRHLAV